ncbi:MAG: microcyclamide/patellamide family RiPP [Spirulina sp. SIO3F2]|nr:microcyclamide/patellamide family RiPP [Spirulina sp. SIO3F2]
MNKKNIAPPAQHPIVRKPAGQLPDALAELAEESLSQISLEALADGADSCCCTCPCCCCSYDGDDVE